jgi:hypothetical protein
VYLNEYSLDESEADENDQPADKVDANANDTLGVQADEHHIFASEFITKPAENDATQHDSTEVGRGN